MAAQPAPIHTGAFSAPTHVFAYGTLVDPRCLDDVLGHRHAGERLRARLRGFQRITTGAYPYPYIVADAEHAVDGVLVMDLSPEDLRLLDQYEEVDAGMYLREPVEVEAWGCGPSTWRVQACVYVAGPRLIAATNP
jgi:gamma-glutamylcyclotransferase (GGCT)/AIG2-like uncharacterized protein YtfP